MRFIYLVCLFLCSSLPAQKKEAVKVENTPDAVFKAFASAYFQHDLKKMKDLTIFNENLEILLQIPRKNKAQLIKSLAELKTVPIKWFEPGDIVKIHGGQIKVNDLMSNKTRRIGTVRMLDFVYPIAIKKLRIGAWKVDPTFMTQSVRKQVELETKRNRKNFRIDLDGKLIYVNGGEVVKFTDKDQKEHVLKFFKNDIQHYKDGRITFQYHKDMDVFPGPSKTGFVYTMNSELGPEIHVVVYSKGADLKTEQKKFINIWIENYEVQDAIFEKNRLKDVRQSINGREYGGKVMYARVNSKVFYNQFYFVEIEGQLIGIFAKSKNIDAGLLNQYLTIVCENIKSGKRKGRK